MNHYRREPDPSEFIPSAAQTSRLEIFINGILKYPFQKVLESLGELEAVDWGERCLYDVGHPFQKTYNEWKAQNMERAKWVISEIKARDEKRRMIAAQNYVPKAKTKAKKK